MLKKQGSPNIMRVYEFSRQSGIPNKEIIKTLKEAGFDIQNHMSVLSQECIDLLNKQAIPKKDEDKSAAVDKPIIADKIEKIQKESVPAFADLEKTSVQTTKIEEKIKTEEKKTFNIEPMTLGELAERINKSATEIILGLLKKGLSYNKNQVLPENVIDQIVKQYGFDVVKEAAKAVTFDQLVKSGKNQKKRLPVVVVIGHVDHGKTTLLDFIRKTRVALKEKGGITQHLGAYQVSTPQGSMIFLDTPGHEAFSMMRTRGVRVADIAILVVAADDGVMPQTIEAIKLAKLKNIPMIVAINKADKVEPSRIDEIKTQLAKQDLLAEDWGGQIICVPISAKLGTNIDQLLEMVILQSEIMDLSADESEKASGYVLESKFATGLGPVATFIAQQGTIKVGDFFIAGNSFGKVTTLIDSYGKRIIEAGPSIPVQIVGFSELAQVGDYLNVVSEEEFRKFKAEKSGRKNVQSTKSIPEEAVNVIIKTDNDSSKEALMGSLDQLSKKNATNLYVIYSGVGNINENDVVLASNFNAIIYGFGVKIDSNVSGLAQKKSVSVRIFDIIYHLIDDVKELLKSSQKIVFKRVKTGEASIRKIFDIKGIGIVAGFAVKEGKILKNGKIVIFRGNRKVGEGSIKTLQRERRDMKEIAAGFEGAFLLEGFQDWAIDDRAECFIEVAADQ